MDPRHLFFDQRLKGMCVYCGRKPNTRDHVPSRVFLDEPLPPNLPVVDACEKCNNNFSKHEQYVACLLECAISGSAELGGVERDNVRTMLKEIPKLRSRILENRVADDSGNLVWHIEEDRVRTVILKLARGHAAFELSLQLWREPEEILFVPLIAMTDKQRIAFESTVKPSISLWPEIGSRAFVRAVKSYPIASCKNAWTIVQPNRYRYFVDQTEGTAVQIVLSEYLACRVVWL